MNRSTTMSSVKGMTTPSMMMIMITTAARASLLGVVRFHFAPPMTPWSPFSLLERHLWRLIRYTLKRLMWRFILTIHHNAPL